MRSDQGFKRKIYPTHTIKVTLQTPHIPKKEKEKVIFLIQYHVSFWKTHLEHSVLVTQDNRQYWVDSELFWCYIRHWLKIHVSSKGDYTRL